MFKSLTIEDIPLLSSYLQSQTYRSSSYTLGALFIYQYFFHPMFCVEQETLIIQIHDYLGRLSYLYPLGKNQDEVALRYGPYSLTPKTAFPEGYLLEAEAGDEDYIYDFEELCTLKGKKFQKVRNHLNRFKKQYPHSHFHPITKENLQDCFTVLDCQSSTTKGSKEDVENCRRFLPLYFSFPFIGFILYDDQFPIAFCIGEVIQDTLHIQIEKINRDYDGVGDMLRISFLQQCQGREIRYVNRQENLGVEGMRFQKESLHPAYLLPHYYGGRKNA